MNTTTVTVTAGTVGMGRKIHIGYNAVPNCAGVRKGGQRVAPLVTLGVLGEIGGPTATATALLAAGIRPENVCRTCLGQAADLMAATPELDTTAAEELEAATARAEATLAELDEAKAAGRIPADAEPVDTRTIAEQDADTIRAAAAVVDAYYRTARIADVAPALDAAILELARAQRRNA